MTISRRNFMALLSMVGLNIPGISKANGTSEHQNKKSIVVYYSHTGNVKTIAESIARLTNSRIVVIEPVTPYPAAYSETTEIVQEQMRNGITPPIQLPTVDFNNYNTIYVGSPTWWGHISKPIERFLSDVNLEGKTIRLFTSHGGSGVANTLSDVRRICPNATVTRSIAFRGSSRASESILQEWISNP